MPRCDTCLNSNICISCTTIGGTYYLTHPPSKFVYYKDACLTCQEARPNCLTCSSTAGIGPTCDTCADKFYLLNYSCFPCAFSCALCSSPTVCTSCINSKYALNNQFCPPCS